MTLTLKMLLESFTHIQSLLEDCGFEHEKEKVFFFPGVIEAEASNLNLLVVSDEEHKEFEEQRCVLLQQELQDKWPCVVKVCTIALIDPLYLEWIQENKIAFTADPDGITEDKNITFKALSQTEKDQLELTRSARDQILRRKTATFRL